MVDKISKRFSKSGNRRCKDLCHSVVVDGVEQAKLSHIDVQTQKGDHFEFFNGPVSVSSVSNGKDTLVELRAAGSGQHTSRDDWSASLAMDTCCCNTSLYPVAILWASPKARSSRRFLGLKTTCNCSRTNRRITQLDETWIVFKKRHTQSDTPQSGSSTGITTRI